MDFSVVSDAPESDVSDMLSGCGERLFVKKLHLSPDGVLLCCVGVVCVGCFITNDAITGVRAAAPSPRIAKKLNSV